MLEASGFETNGVEGNPGVNSQHEKGKGRGPSSQGTPWGKGPYPRELPLPRSLPSGRNSVPRRCPPQDEGAGAFPFYGG